MTKSEHSNIYCIYVSDFYRLQKQIKLITKDIKIQPTNIDFSSGISDSLKIVEEYLQNLSLFQEEKFLIIKNLDGINATQAKTLAKCLESCADSDLVILTGETKKAHFKVFSSFGKMIELKKLDENEFGVLAKEIIKLVDLKIDDNAVRYLSQSCDLDIDLFNKRSEHLKLLFQNNQVKLDKVTEIFPSDIQHSAFELLNLIDKKDLTALSYLNNFKLDSGETLGIIGLLSKHYQDLLSIKLLGGTNLQETLKLPEWLLKKKVTLSNQHSEQQLRKKLLQILKADSKVKNYNLGHQSIMVDLVKSLCV